MDDLMDWKTVLKISYGWFLYDISYRFLFLSWIVTFSVCSELKRRRDIDVIRIRNKYYTWRFSWEERQKFVARIQTPIGSVIAEHFRGKRTPLLIFEHTPPPSSNGEPQNFSLPWVQSFMKRARHAWKDARRDFRATFEWPKMKNFKTDQILWASSNQISGQISRQKVVFQWICK